MNGQNQDLELPDVLDISPEAIAAAESSLDPEAKPPADARKDTDKKGNEYFRWSESLVIEKASRKRSTSGLTGFEIQSKIRPNGEEGHANAGKRIWTRYYINYKVLGGQEQNESHTIMNRLSLRAIASLMKATGFLPDDASSKGLSASYLIAMFPAESEPVNSPFNGKVVTGTISNGPDKREGARNPRNNSVESWLPAAE